MKIRNYILTVSIASALFLFGGCSSKNVYKPEKVAKELSYKQTEEIHVNNVVREGATLSNQKILSKQNGLSQITIGKDFRFVNDDESKVIAVSKEGILNVLDYSDGSTIFSKAFGTPIVSATAKGDILALVLATNTIMLYDMQSNSTLYEEALEKVITVDARAANPIFLNDLVVFPTLDGRLLIMDITKKVILRDVAISDKTLFNNVIYLKVADNKLVTATASKVMVITPTNIYTHKEDIKDIVYVDDAIYLFAKNGMVLLMDEKLQERSHKKFNFANFLSIAHNNGKLYAVEKEGYVITMDRKLENIAIDKLFDEVEKSVLMVKGVLYIDDKRINLP